MKKMRLKREIDHIFDLFTERENKEWFAHMRKSRVQDALIEGKLIADIGERGEIRAVLVWSVFKANSNTYIGMKGDFQIKQIVVSEKEKGKGRAQYIFREAVVMAGALGCFRIVLTVRDDNKRAQAFYKKEGMVLVKRTTVVTRISKKRMRYAEYALVINKRGGLLR